MTLCNVRYVINIRLIKRKAINTTFSCLYVLSVDFCNNKPCTPNLIVNEIPWRRLQLCICMSIVYNHLVAIYNIYHITKRCIRNDTLMF